MEEKLRCARICPPAEFFISYRIHATLDRLEYNQSPAKVILRASELFES